MFNSTVLEVAIGLAFVYLLLSLICSAINEFIARWFQLRSDKLEKGIQRLLVDLKIKQDDKEVSISDILYQNPLIQGLTIDGKKPTYIPSATFVEALLKIIESGNAENNKTALTQAAKETAARAQDAKKVAARAQDAKEIATRVQAQKEATARVQAEKEATARVQAVKEAVDLAQAAKEAADHVQATEDAATLAQTAKEAADRAQTAKDAAARDQAAKEAVARDQAEKDAATLAQAVKEAVDLAQAAKEAADLAQAAEDAVARRRHRTISSLRDSIEALPNTKMKESLFGLIDTTAENLDEAQKNLERWFDDSMEEVSAWYQRHANSLLFGVAFVVCLLMNADSIRIGRTLWRDPTLRAAVVKVAEEAAKKDPNEEDQTKSTADRIAEVQQDLDSLKIPVGWTQSEIDSFWSWASCWPNWASTFWTVEKLFGILFTTVAVSLGGPFWFDMLNKLINFRSAAKKPKRTEDEETETNRGSR